MKPKLILSATVGAVALALLAGSLSACSTNIAPSPEPSATANAMETTTSTAIEQALTFIIEEEKLAYDVYTVLGATWNLRPMQNIVRSEATHQSQVETLLATYGVSDPRSSEIGAFTNPDLQQLYDELITQGSASATEAIQVGILIEKTDITDIDEMLAADLPDDIVSVLENLKAGSLNHLEAFERQS